MTADAKSPERAAADWRARFHTGGIAVPAQLLLGGLGVCPTCGGRTAWGTPAVPSPCTACRRANAQARRRETLDRQYDAAPMVQPFKLRCVASRSKKCGTLPLISKETGGTR